MLFQIKSSDIILNNLPPPTTAHCDAVTALLQKVISEQALSPDSLDQRMNMQATIIEFAKLHFPGNLELICEYCLGFVLEDRKFGQIQSTLTDDDKLMEQIVYLL